MNTHNKWNRITATWDDEPEVTREEEPVMSLGDKLEELLNISLVLNIARGIFTSLAVMFVLLTVATGIMALAWTAWWILGFIGCGLIAGISVGVSIYLFDEY